MSYEPRGASEKIHYRCPCCGSLRDRWAFVRGSNPGHAIQTLTQHFVGRGNGTNGGPVVWDRRPMSLPEMQLVGRAVARAAANVDARLHGADLPDLDFLSAIDDPSIDMETFQQLAQMWRNYVESMIHEAEERRFR